MKPADIVRQRSGGRCEAYVQVHNIFQETWARCWKGPVEVHHLLTRARGGAILDEAGETLHLIALCPRCHRAADGKEAYERGLLIDGYVTTENGRIVYQGSDKFLSHKYPKEES